MSKQTKPINGISMPILSYRFRVIFGGGLIYNEQMVLTRNVEKCSIDMVNNTFSVTVRQSVEPSVFNLINFIVSQKATPIYLEPLDGRNTDSLMSIELSECECIEHNIDFNYGNSEVARHIMKFKYDKLHEMLPIDWENETNE